MPKTSNKIKQREYYVQANSASTASHVQANSASTALHVQTKLIQNPALHTIYLNKQKEQRNSNILQQRKQQKIYREINKKAILTRGAEYRKNNKDLTKERMVVYRELNKAAIKKQRAEYYKKTKAAQKL